MILLLKTFAGDHDCVPQGAIVHIDKKYAEVLLKRVDAARKVHAKLGSVYGIDFWDGAADFLSCDEAPSGEGQELLCNIEDAEYAELTEEQLNDAKFVSERMECQMLRAEVDEILWTGIVRNTDVTVETSQVKVEVLEKVAGRKAWSPKKK